MPFWLRLTLAFVIISCLLLWGFGADLQTGISLLILAAGVVPAIIRHSPKLYLRVQYFRYYLANTETTWDLALQFRGAIDPSRIDEFLEGLARRDPQGTLLLQSSSDRRLVRYNRIFTLEFLLSEEETVDIGASRPTGDLRRVDVTLFEQQVGFRRSKSMLEESLIPLIEQFRNAMHPDSSSYALRVRFTGANPFVGMYIQQLRPELLRDFQFEFTLPAAEPGDYVRVDRTKLVVWASSLESFRRAALAGLTFSTAAR